MRVVPITLAEANAYIALVHRHNGALPAAKLQCALCDDDGFVLGVAIAGLPKARLLMGRTTLEINRVGTEGARNGCSMLYAACIRAGKALGYTRFITYTLTSEPGSSLRAVGFKPLAVFAGGKWSELRGTGFDRHNTGAKVRWELGARYDVRLQWPTMSDTMPLLEAMHGDRP